MKYVFTLYVFLCLHYLSHGQVHTGIEHTAKVEQELFIKTINSSFLASDSVAKVVYWKNKTIPVIYSLNSSVSVDRQEFLLDLKDTLNFKQDSLNYDLEYFFSNSNIAVTEVLDYLKLEAKKEYFLLVHISNDEWRMASMLNSSVVNVDLYYIIVGFGEAKIKKRDSVPIFFKED